MGLIKLALEKRAGLLDAGLALGKGLLKNNVVKNTLIGAGTGMLSGAISAPQGQGIKGALKGAAIGGLLGGVGTFGKRTYDTAKTLSQIPGNTSNFGTNLLSAAGRQGTALKKTVQFAGQDAKMAYNLKP